MLVRLYKCITTSNKLCTTVFVLPNLNCVQDQEHNESCHLEEAGWVL